MTCPTCKHEEHRPGQCPKDDCGESEIVRPRVDPSVHRPNHLVRTHLGMVAFAPPQTTKKRG